MSPKSIQKQRRKWLANKEVLERDIAQAKTERLQFIFNTLKERASEMMFMLSPLWIGVLCFVLYRLFWG